MSQPPYPSRPLSGHPVRNAILLGLGFLLVIFGSSFLTLYVDWMWYREVQFAQVFKTVLLTRIGLGAGAGLICFALLFINLKIAAGYPHDNLHRMLDQAGQPHMKGILDRYMVPVIATIAALFSIASGFKASAEWESFLLFTSGGAFGQADPELGRDLGFYVFSLPFVHAAQAWLFGNLMLCAVVVGGIYMLLGGIFVTPSGPVINLRVCRHLGVLLALVFLAVGWGFYLSIFDILFSKNGVVTGATYADIHARMPAYKLLTAVSVLVAGIFAVLGWRGQWKIPAMAAIGLVLLSILGVNMLPGLLQKYRVTPNEIVMESKYIQRNIEATRTGFGLNRVTAEEFPAEETLTTSLLDANRNTIENVRLWDHKPLLSTYRQLQQIRTYYDFVDVDNDRYMIDGNIRQVMLSPRELSYNNLPGGENWINEHLTYTHGYGVSIGPVNRISPEGLPEFYVKDIPPVSTTDALKVTRPEIYFGELGNEYVFVRTNAKEFDYPVGDKNEYATYQGKGGVPMAGAFNKLAFAMHFKTTKILFSSDLVPESRIMYNRNILDRVGKVAPYLIWDRDPYMVVTNDGRLVWMLDGYTVTDHLPYSERLGGSGHNYIRNSVKAVVDAYHGSITLYISDPDDPIIAAYEKVFPGTYQPLSAMPDDIRAHMRYPQGLFSVQAHVLQKYHMQDPQIFYNNEDLWEIPRQGDTTMQPYYTIMKLPGADQEEFILLSPYTPARRDNMTAWLATRSDGEHYGKMVVYLFPKQKLIYGPRQIEARIDQNAEISKQLTLWSQRGSSVIRGTLLVIPIEESLLYIEPLYLSAERGSLPELRRVIVSYGNKVAMEPNLEMALQTIFGSGYTSAAPVGETAAVGAPAVPQTLAELAEQAQDLFESAQEAQRQGDWAGYGEKIKELETVLGDMNR